MASFPDSLAAPLGAAAQRKALVRHYKDNPPPMGVYAVRCTAAQLVYVRTSTNMPGAFNRERFQLRLGNHPDKPLQHAWRTQGAAQVEFEVLDTIKLRPDATDADYRNELAALLALWQEELCAAQGAAS